MSASHIIGRIARAKQGGPRLARGFAVAGGLVIIVVVALILWVRGGGPDEGRARREVQAYYNKIAPNRYRVGHCEFIGNRPGADSDYDGFECEVARFCKRQFSVPRAASFVRSDYDPRPREREACP
jgi:hypothetical protein